MSGLYENLPFARGDTFSGAGNAPPALPSGETYFQQQLLGKEFIIQDDQYGTGLYVKLRAVVNASGATLNAKRAVKFANIAGLGHCVVSGYCDVANELTAIVDDKLPPIGVANGDVFFVVVAGPVMALTGLAGDVTNSIAVGDYLMALTAATTGATTSGRVGEASWTGATGSALATDILQIVGTAMSAVTTTQTNVNILINAGFPNW